MRGKLDKFYQLRREPTAAWTKLITWPVDKWRRESSQSSCSVSTSFPTCVSSQFEPFECTYTAACLAIHVEPALSIACFRVLCFATLVDSCLSHHIDFNQLCFCLNCRV